MRPGLFVAPRTLPRVIVAGFLTAAALLCSGYGLARGAKTSPTVNRPISYLTATSSFQIALIDELGSSSVTVNRNASDSYARWSPDGLFIGGYYRTGTDWAIMVMTPSGANEHAILTESAFHAWNLARPGVQDSTGFDFFSSNCWLGTDAIIFTAETTYDASFFGEQGPAITLNRLFIVDAGGAIWPLTESAPHAGTHDLDPHWSAALGKVVFISTGDLQPELYAINPDGTGLQQITTFGGSADYLGWPVWSPAGDRIVVAVHPVRSDWQLWILDVDLSQPDPGPGAGGRVTAVDPFKVVDGGGGYVQTAAWSPDGTRIVLSRTVFDNNNRRFFELVIADAASGAETLIKRSSGDIELPDWNPVP